ncbi:MAG TPA: NAD(P)-binding oxidoreductase [Archangium sp.]|uniref:NAD(P)-binding oxidoreductase n=1 Tax=Archangium sp. TaxID=1872627 RepID=UPI002E309162|nr:NAD(P)-binding oxidoreductase [Archangium sp.]HEX5752000.1 NAD(P)-binding oxidoreductase [Archangium sp.]
MSEGTASIIAAMKAGGVSRLLVITSGMVTPTGTEPLFFRFIGRHLLRHVHADHLRLEEHVKASGLDWTIVRPPRLLDGPARGATASLATRACPVAVSSPVPTWRAS